MSDRGGALGWLSRYYRRMMPTWDEEFPAPPHARVHRDGSFEWEPVGTPRIQVRHGIVHRWWDAERGGRFEASISFDIPDAVRAAELRSATRRALNAATRALPSRGKVRATGAARDEPGPTSLVRVRLRVQGIGARPEWALVAAEEFARAFLRELEKDGHSSSAR